MNEVAPGRGQSCPEHRSACPASGGPAGQQDEDTAKGASLTLGASSGSCRSRKWVPPMLLSAVTASCGARETDLEFAYSRPPLLQQELRPKCDDGLAEVTGQLAERQPPKSSSFGSPPALAPSAHRDAPSLARAPRPLVPTR